ncbi:MAG: prealbumin-like fold domain-containing protein, partial [Gemmatimonadetes bacterium]|nr:prealbumin-like fold domain-containing protein [Gemmatimonadota bacterium]
SMFSRIPLILSAMFFAGLLHATSPPISDETGIMGKVFRGPVEGGPAIWAESDEAPFRAVFYVMESGREVARFESDEQGRFKVSLPPGEYTIVPDKSAPVLFPHRQKKNVTVPADDYAEVTLRFDTGMR